jgi:hypothetical protein
VQGKRSRGGGRREAGEPRCGGAGGDPRHSGELAALQNRQKAFAKLERDREALLEHYSAIAPEALDSLAPEERYQLYKMLRLNVVVRLDANLEVSGCSGMVCSLVTCS